MLVPKLRFGEFKDEWKFYKFYDVVKITNGQVNPNDNQYRNLPHIGPGNIEKRTGRLLKYNLAKNDNLISSKYLFDQNSVIYGKINPHFAKVCYPNFIGLCSADTYPINPNNSLLISQFLLYMLLTKKFTKFAISVSMRTGMPKINRNELGTYKFIIPPIVEQEKIANFLSLLDQKIEMQNKKIETLKIYKTGLFNKIYEEKMKTIKEEEIKKYVYLQGGYAFKSKLFSKNGIPIIRIANINENIVDLKDIVFYNEKIEIDSKFEINTGDILIAMSGATTGKIGIYKEKTKSYLNQRIGKIVLKSEDIIYSYLYFLFELSSYNMQLNTKLVAGAQPNISPTDIETLKFKVPSIDMQEYISNIAMSMNKKIKIEEKKLQKLNNVKKSLLQQMFI